MIHDYPYKIRVQKGVPFPPPLARGTSRLGKGGRAAVYPWAKMAVGDSFLFPPNVTRAVHSNAAQASKDGKLFVVRLMDDGRYRCWRIK